MSDFNDKPVGILGAVITIEDDLKEIASKLILSENNLRKERAAKRLRWYFSEMEHDMRELYREQYQEWDLIQHVIEYENVIRPIIDKTSLVYKDAPVRTIVDDKQETDDAGQETYDKIAKNSELNVVMKKVDSLTTLLNRTVVKAAWRDRHVVLDIITPDILDIIVDEQDALKPVAMVWASDPVNTARIVKDTAGHTRIFAFEDIKFEFWSTDEHPLFPAKHFMFDGSGKILPNPKNLKNENPYKDPDGKSILPCAAYASDYPVGNWWIGGGEDLVNGNEAVNKLLTDMQFLAKMQSFSLLVATGVETADKINVGVTELIKIPAGVPGENEPDMKYITPEARLEDLLKTLEAKIRRMAQYRNLSVESFTLTGSPMSGIALKLKNFNLIEDREDKIELYRPSDNQLFIVMRAVHNQWSDPSDMLSEKLGMLIDYAEVKFPEDPKVELDRANQGFELNLDNPIAWLMRKNPDLSEKQAEELYAKNIEINQRTSSPLVATLRTMAQRTSDSLNGDQDQNQTGEGDEDGQ